MSRTAGRDAADTRRQIIDAAITLIAQHGSGVAVADIAREAGVSKGGLLYHFASKDALLEAVARALFDDFRNAVYDAAAGDDAAGSLTRAYIRVSFADGTDPEHMRKMIAVAAQLMNIDALQQLGDADGVRWRDELMADGLDPATVRLVIAATDGVSSAPLWGTLLNSHDQRALEAQLLSLATP